MEVCQEVIRVTTAGSAGSASGSASSAALSGELLDFKVDFHASAPGATTDITIADQFGTLWAATNTATDVFVAPRQKHVDNANAAITNSFSRFPLNGPVTVSLAQTDALTDAVVVTLRYLRY